LVYGKNGNKVNNVHGENGGQSQQRRAGWRSSVGGLFIASVFAVNQPWPFFALFAFFAVPPPLCL